MSIEHGKIITVDKFYDNVLTATETLFEIPVYTDKQNLLKDVIDALAVVNSKETTKLELCISIDSLGRYKLTKTWRVSRVVA
jgi:hypothetical protein